MKLINSILALFVSVIVIASAIVYVQGFPVMMLTLISIALFYVYFTLEVNDMFRRFKLMLRKVKRIYVFDATGDWYSFQVKTNKQSLKDTSLFEFIGIDTYGDFKLKEKRYVGQCFRIKGLHELMNVNSLRRVNG